MAKNIVIDDSPVDVSTEVNFIWSIANKLRGTYTVHTDSGACKPNFQVERVRLYRLRYGRYSFSRRGAHVCAYRKYF